MSLKTKINKNKQLKIIDKATDKAIRQVENESRGKDRDYIVEWFRYIEITSKQLKKYLN